MMMIIIIENLKETKRTIKLKNVHKALQPRDDGLCVKKKEKEGSPALGILLIHPQKYSVTALKRAKKD